MNNQVSLSRYILVILCVSIVFTALTLIVLNSWVQNKRLSDLTSNVPGLNQLTGKTFEDGYKAGYLAAKEKYRSVPPTPEGVAVLSLMGTINSVDGQQLSVTATSLDTDPTVDGVPNERTIVVSTSTSIVLRTNLSAQDFTKKMEEWNKSEDKTKVTPPTPYTEKSLSISDLKPGQTISVTSNEDLRLLTTIKAKQIVLVATK